MPLEELTQTVIAYEAQLRLGVFLGVFFIMAMCEIAFPRRQLTQKKSLRWLSNISIVVINSLLVRLIFPAAAVGMAIFIEEKQWGLFHWLALPTLVEVIVAALFLDLAIYGQHVLVHYVPLLWRFHRMHHADLDFDVTTGSRFHPVEIIFSMGLKFCFIAVLGAPVLAVFIFETILNGAAMFNHSNVKIPRSVDRVLRLFIVTPDMHRVHHSSIMRETNSNFGFNFPWWDRVFKTYNDQPEKGHIDMTIGLENIREHKNCVGLSGMLKIPLLKS